MNGLDARLERLAAEATKDVTPPDVEVIVRRGRRRRALSRPVLAGTVALVLVLAAVVALAAVRGQGPPPAGPPATTVPTPSTVATNADFHVLPVPQASVRNVQVSAGLAVQDQGPPH